MDPGPGPRAGRTFWTFWNYITDIVSRFLRPEPPGTEIHDTNTTHSGNDELLESHKKDNFSSPTEEAEEHFVLTSSVSSTRPIVFWDSGSELQSEMRQNIVEEDDKIMEKDDGIIEEEIETGIDVASNLPITLSTMDNHDQSSDMTKNVEELEEIMNIDLEGSNQANKPQDKDHLNENFKEEKSTIPAVEVEITSELDTRTVEQEQCEQCDGKLQSDSVALEESAPILEKLERADDDGTEESANDDNKNAVKGAEEIEIENMSDEEQNNETEMCQTTTNLDLTRESTCMIEATDGSSKELNGMCKEDMKKLHTSLVLEKEDMSGRDDNSDSNECKKGDTIVTQSNPDMERLSDVEPSISNNNYVLVLEDERLTVANNVDESANVKSENAEKETEFKEDQSEISENDVDMTLDVEDGDNSKETCPAVIIDPDATQQKTYTLEVVDSESSTEELKDTDKDDLNKLHTSLVLETEDMSGWDDNSDSNECQKDDTIAMQSNVDLERLSNVESSISNNNYVLELEDESLTVANKVDESANVKSENAEKVIEFNKDQSEISESDLDMTDGNRTLDVEDGDNSKETCPAVIIDPDMTQQKTYTEVVDSESSTEELKDMDKDDLNKLHTSLVLETEDMSGEDDNSESNQCQKGDTIATQSNPDMERLSDVESSISNNNYVLVLEDERLTVANKVDESANVKSENAEKETEFKEDQSEISENDVDMTLDVEVGDNSMETCPAVIIDPDMTQQKTYMLEVVDSESSTEELKDKDKDDLNKLHTSLVLETEDMSGEDDNIDSNECQNGDTIATQNNPDMERLSNVESSISNNNYVLELEDERLTVANKVDESANVKSENAEKETEFKEDQSEILEHNVDMTERNTTLDAEDGDNSKETCLALIIDPDMTQQKTYTLKVVDSESSTEELKDMDKEDLNKLHTSLVLETELLSILNNKTVQNEDCKVQGTNDSIISHEVNPCTSKQEEHTATDKNEESGYGDTENKKCDKLEQDIFEEESDNSDSTRNIEAEEQLDFARETHISRFDLDLEGIFDHVEVSSEIDSSMEKLCVTIINKGGSTQEQASAFKNIPTGECEGNECPYSYKESSEEVPDYNNESDNGSATQRFLEVGNCRENQTTLLQEEAESGAAKCLQNSSTREGEDSFEDLMETELIKNSLEEHILRTEEKTPLPDMKTTSEYTKYETYFVSEEDVEEKGEDLKEETREIEFEMRDNLRDLDTIVEGVETQDGQTEQTEFQNCVFLDQPTLKNESNARTVERSFVEMQTTEMDHVSDAEDSFFTFEEEVTKVKLQSTDEDSTTVSNDDVLSGIVHHEISANTFEDVQQRCMLEQLTCGDVIEDDILDLWIQQTSVESSEMREEDQEHENSWCDLLEEEKVESMTELSIACDVNKCLSTTESGLFEPSLDNGSSLKCNKQELPKEEQIVNTSCKLNKSEDLSECSIAEPELETPLSEDLLKSLVKTPEDTDDDEALTSQDIDVVSLSSLVMQNNGTFSIQTDDKPFATLEALSEPDILTKDQSESLSEIKNATHMSVTPTEGCQLPLQEKSKVEALQEFQRMEDKIDVSKLDFTPQKSRIAVKNPSVRPPKDFRSLLQKPSLEPSPSKHLESHVPAGAPMGGLGIRVKLPGLGSGFPVLKKTKKAVEEETERTTQETKTVEEEEDHKPKQEDSHQRPKWMPPSHPSFGNPLMSELKSKLKKPAKE